MSLKVTTEPRENRQLQVMIEVDQARVEEQLRRAARKLAREYRIPGFRKGKAPYNIIVQYLGEHTLYNEIIDDLGQKVYLEAIEQEKLEPYALASLENISFGPLTYQLVMPLEPTIALGDYRALRVDEDPVEVDEDQVTARLESYREQYAGWQEVDRPSEFGDMLNIDVRSVIPAAGEDGEETVVLDESDWDVTPDLENPMEPPGFDEALVGIKPGEEAEMELSWPEDSQSIYAGKTAKFTVTLNSIQSYVKPELNDEFAQLVGPDFETLDDLRENIRTTLRERAEQESSNQYLDKVLDALLAQSTLDYPPVVVEDQINSMVSEFEQRLRQFGVTDVDGYFAQVGQSREQYRESLREQAEQAAQRNLLISELWKQEQIKATDADLDAKIREIVGTPDGDEQDEEMTGQMNSLAAVLREGSGRSIMEAQIVQQKTIARLLAIARGEEIPEPDADDADADAAPETDAPAAELSAEPHAEVAPVAEVEPAAGDEATESAQES